MELKQIKELMNAMVRCGLSKLHLKNADFELDLERDKKEEGEVFSKGDPLLSQVALSQRVLGSHPTQNLPVHTTLMAPQQPAMKELLPSEEAAKVREKGSSDSKGKYITSPMVGTFYSSPSPEDPPFVKVGDVVDEESVVCIVEAMKVMNEVKAGVKGTVVEILMEDSNLVEFGSKIFRVE